VGRPYDVAKTARGKTQYDLARRLLKAALDVRDNVKHARNPAIFGGEISSELTEFGVNEDPAVASRYDSNRAVYGRRMRHVDDVVSEFSTV
jgi:hypothetical protein